jgi:hypothetical protein
MELDLNASPQRHGDTERNKTVLLRDLGFSSAGAKLASG